MKCTEFRENIASLFDLADNNDPIVPQMREHLASCAECRSYYDSFRATFEALTPRTEPQCDEAFEDRLISAIENHQKPSAKPRRLVWRLTAGAISIAAMLLVVLNLSLPTPVQAAKESFTEAVALFSRAKSMRMEVAIRTNPTENFDYIDPHADFVDMVVETIFSTPNIWRIDKGDRVAMCDGERYCSWVQSLGLGWINHAYGSENEQLLTLLSDPSVIMLYEQALIRMQSGASYRHEVRDGVVYVLVEGRDMGDYSQSDYSRYSSILEMDSRREYSFDEESGKLLSGKITMLTDDEERVILEIKSIAYDLPLDEQLLTESPKGIDFADVRSMTYGTMLQNMSAREAAEKIFVAMGVWEVNILKEASPYFDVELLRDRYEGCVILEIKESVKSGTYAGEFVPVTLLFRDGDVEELMVALRNDNQQRSWVLDGGV